MPVLDTLLSGLSSSLFQEVTRMTETINKTKRICCVFFLHQVLETSFYFFSLVSFFWCFLCAFLLY